MRSIVDQKALDEFLARADVYEARRAAAALDAMASAARLAVVELETADARHGDGGQTSSPPAIAFNVSKRSIR